MKKLLALLPLLALLLTLSGCLDPEPAEAPGFWEVEPEFVAPAADPVRITEFTLPYLSSQTFDPIACSDGVQQAVGSLLYESLFVLDEQFVPQPCLCASYSTSSNGLTYTFRIRDMVTFSDGSSLTANDVLATYRRAQASERYAARFLNVASMHVNRSSLVVTLKQADAGLPALLDIPIVKSGTEKRTVPLGSGPYWFRSDEEGTCLARRENWWQGSGDLPAQIALTPAKDADTALYLYSANVVHLLTADLLGETSVGVFGGSDAADAPSTVLLFLGFNEKRSLLADAGLRAAISASVDRASVAGALLASHARPAQFPISPASPLYPAAQETPYDAAAFAAALPEDGEPVELTLLVNEENSFKVALAEHLARQLTSERVSVTSLSLPWADYLAALQRGEFDLWLGEVRLTADWDVSALFAVGGALNYGRFSSAELEKALAAFLADETPEAAAAFCELFAKESPFLPLAFKNITVLTTKGVVEGVSPTATQPLRGWGTWQIHIPES